MSNRKAFAYITCGMRLLVFRHVDFPEAGIQVPGGTVGAGESFKAAALREAWEETGLTGLQMVGLIGKLVKDMSEYGIHQIQVQRFFHLLCTENPPETWRHSEEDASDGSGSIRFEFFWVALPDGVPILAGTQGYFIPQLIENI